MVGGGPHLRPGLVTQAHHGVLFLDELAEFDRDVLDALRQPLEDGSVEVARAHGSVTYPARLQLIAAMNPCRCGWHGDPARACRCPVGEPERYTRRVSGPLRDRIDLRVTMPRMEAREIDRGRAARGQRRGRCPDRGGLAPRPDTQRRSRERPAARAAAAGGLRPRTAGQGRPAGRGPRPRAHGSQRPSRVARGTHDRRPSPGGLRGPRRDPRGGLAPGAATGRRDGRMTPRGRCPSERHGSPWPVPRVSAPSRSGGSWRPSAMPAERSRPRPAGVPRQPMRRWRGGLARGSGQGSRPPSVQPRWSLMRSSGGWRPSTAGC